MVFFFFFLLTLKYIDIKVGSFYQFFFFFLLVFFAASRAFRDLTWCVSQELYELKTPLVCKVIIPIIKKHHCE